MQYIFVAGHSLHKPTLSHSKSINSCKWVRKHCDLQEVFRVVRIVGPMDVVSFIQLSLAAFVIFMFFIVHAFASPIELKITTYFFSRN